MINFAVSRAALAAMPGDLVAMTKAQADELLTVAERGQLAELALKNLHVGVQLAAAAPGTPA